MQKDISPKRLQRGRRFREALENYLERYLSSLEEGDRFLSALYMDEIAQTILMETQHRSEEGLKQYLDKVAAQIPEHMLSDYLEDVEIELRKRFPEKYGVEKEEVSKQLR